MQQARARNEAMLAAQNGGVLNTQAGKTTIGDQSLNLSIGGFNSAGNHLISKSKHVLIVTAKLKINAIHHPVTKI